MYNLDGSSWSQLACVVIAKVVIVTMLCVSLMCIHKLGYHVSCSPLIIYCGLQLRSTGYVSDIFRFECVETGASGMKIS